MFICCFRNELLQQKQLNVDQTKEHMKELIYLIYFFKKKTQKFSERLLFSNGK